MLSFNICIFFVKIIAGELVFGLKALLAAGAVVVLFCQKSQKFQIDFLVWYILVQSVKSVHQYFHFFVKKLSILRFQT